MMKKIIEHVVAILILLVIASIYFLPEIKGKKILSHDQVSAASAAKEVTDYQENEGEQILWGTRVFSGMPMFQMAYKVSSNYLYYFTSMHHILPKSMWLWFMLLLGGYIGFSIWGVDVGLRIMGAVGFALSTWLLLIIEAGHSSKVLVVACIPPLIASVWTFYKGKWLTGGVLSMLFVGLSITMNHVQIVYYSMFFIAVLLIVQGIDYAKNGRFPLYIKRSFLLLGFAVLGVLPNITNLWVTYDYAKETIRGGVSELAEGADASGEEKGSGLDWDYAMSWSYGVSESVNLFVPGAFGSGFQLDEDSEMFSYFKGKNIPKKQALQYLKQLPMYYGPQRFTSGPAYMGAVLIVLFMLFLVLYKGEIKWALLAMAILTLFFAWGKHLSFWNELFYDYFPMFNKFRAPSTWLSMLIVTISLGAILFLSELFKGKYVWQEIKISFLIVVGTLGGLCLLLVIMGSGLFDFNGGMDAQLEKQGIPIANLIDDRISLLQSDAFRTLIFVLLTAAGVYLIVEKKIQNYWLQVAVFLCLIVFDMWAVDKRLVNDDDFSRAKSFTDNIRKTAVDAQILQDQDPHYRVFNTTVSSFNDLSTSYYHRSAGGYSAAKLLRYQDLIEKQLSKGNMSVLNMLDVKYFIVGQPGGEQVQQNPGAMGAAWFVDSLKWVDGAHEEMDALTGFNPRQTAIIDKAQESDVPNKAITGGGAIGLKKYHPMEVVYETQSNVDGFAVFSEIWYRGNVDWKAYIDDKEVPFARVNYVLRGMSVPKGNHEVKFVFHPKAHYTGSTISAISSVLIYLILFGVLWLKFKGDEKWANI